MSEQKPTYRDMVDSYGGKTEAEWDEHLAEPAAQPAPEQWHAREHSKLDGLQVYAVSTAPDPSYSPDRTWLIIGTGAAGRLTDTLNALEAERDALRVALQGLVADYDWSAGGKNIYAKEHPVTIARAALDAAQKEGR